LAESNGAQKLREWPRIMSPAELPAAKAALPPRVTPFSKGHAGQSVIHDHVFLDQTFH
jgi:hypothetical protein